MRRTSTTYEVRGMREKVTSYDNATVGCGSVVNEVVYEYNDLGMLTKEYQEHEGAKDASTLYVQYNFDTTASGGKYTKGLRPSSVRYPNGRLVHFTYGSADSMADALNRLDAIKDDSGGSPGSTLASYSYLGLGTIVIEDYEQPDVRLEYFFSSATPASIASAAWSISGGMTTGRAPIATATRMVMTGPRTARIARTRSPVPRTSSTLTMRSIG